MLQRLFGCIGIAENVSPGRYVKRRTIQNSNGVESAKYVINTYYRLLYPCVLFPYKITTNAHAISSKQEIVSVLFAHCKNSPGAFYFLVFDLGIHVVLSESLRSIQSPKTRICSPSTNSDNVFFGRIKYQPYYYSDYSKFNK